jgi:cystathionine beta-lyase/cystathionine gamma-synthase
MDKKEHEGSPSKSRKPELKRKRGISTACVHAGSSPDPSTGALVTPIYQSSTFAFRDTQHVVNVISGKEKGNVYTRHSNPTTRAVEDKMTELEGAGDSLAFSSGMAAISTLLLALLRSGENIVSMDSLYGGTFELFRDIMPRLGISITLVDGTDPSGVEKAMRPNTRVLYLESPTNPTIRVVDVRRLSEIASSRGVVTVVDNTFATPVNQQPLKLGAQVVAHSATKYLAGHSDLIAGIVSGSSEAVAQVRHFRKILGGVMDPHAAWLLLRGLKTLAVRVEKQNQSAMELALFLRHHPAVERVHYPGLSDNPDHSIAKNQMSGFGGMLSFEVKGGYAGASSFASALRVAALAPSLGGVETLVTQPVTTSHYWLSPAERARAGISDSLVRVSVGLEDVRDLIDDFESALAGIA